MLNRDPRGIDAVVGVMGLFPKDDGIGAERNTVEVDFLCVDARSGRSLFRLGGKDIADPLEAGMPFLRDVMSNIPARAAR